MTDVDVLCLVQAYDLVPFMEKCFGPVPGVMVRSLHQLSSGIWAKEIIVDDGIYIHPRVELNTRCVNEVWALRLRPGCQGNIRRGDVYRYLEARNAAA